MVGQQESASLMDASEVVLIASGDAGMRASIRDGLLQQGHSVETTGDVHQVLAMLSGRSVALVILDLRSPHPDGLSLVTQLRARKPSVGLIAIAESGARGVAIEAMRQGADAYLLCPFETEELALVVRHVINERRLKLEKADALADLWKQRDETRRILEASSYLAHLDPSSTTALDEIMTIARQQLNLTVAITAFGGREESARSQVPVNFHVGWARALSSAMLTRNTFQRVLDGATLRGQSYLIDPGIAATRNNWPGDTAELPSTPLLAVPCQTRRGETVGALWLALDESAPQEYVVRRLEIFASQVAATLEQTQLFAAHTRRINIRDALIAAIHEVATALDSHEVNETVLKGVLTIAPNVEMAALCFPSDERDELRYVAVTGDGQRISDVPLDEQLIREVLREGRSVYLPEWHMLEHQAPRSLLVEPIVLTGRVAGGLIVVGRHSHSFDDDRRHALSVLVRQAACALQNARLFSEARRLDEIEALHEAGLAIGRTLNLQETLTTTLSTVRTLTGAAISNVYLYEPEHRRIDSVITLGDETLLTDADRRRSAEIAWQVLDSRELRLVHQPTLPGVDHQPNIRTWLAVPLMAGGVPVGVLDLGSPEPQAFSSQDIRLTQVIASQSAPAIENARLYEELQRRLQQTEALRVISQSISNTLDLHRVLEMVVRSAALTIPVATHSTLYLLDRAGQKAAPEASFTKQQITPPPDLDDVQTRFIAQTMQRQVPLRLTHEAWSLMAAPLIAGSSVIGAILLKSPRPDAFLSGDESLLNTFASHASIAIQNANLFRDLSATYIDLARRQDEIVRGHRTLQALFDGITDGLYILDRDLHVVAINRAEASRLGRKPEALVGQPCDASLWGEATPLVARIVLDTFESGAGVTWESNTDVDRRGPFAERDVRTYPIYDTSGEASRVILLAQDVSEKRQLQASLFRSANLAAVGRLAASIAHQINNPLTVIIANAQMMQMDTEPDSPNQPILEDVVAAGMRIRRIVENLQDFSAQETYDWFETEIETTIEDALALLAHPLRKSGARVVKHFEPLPTIVASASHLKLLWMNLLLNARDAIVAADRPGTVEVRADQPNADYVRVQIIDDGVGIAPQFRERLFQPFFTTKPPGQGLGLGLHTCRTIVERHGGHIEIGENPVGSGVMVTVLLPIAGCQLGSVASS